MGAVVRTKKKHWVREASDATFFIVPTSTRRRWDYPKAGIIEYNALLVKTSLQTFKLAWVHEASKRHHDAIVNKVLAGEVKSLADLNHLLSQHVTSYGFIPVSLVSSKLEHYL